MAILEHPRVRIVSGPAGVVEHELNQHFDDYVFETIAFNPVGDCVHITVLMIDKRLAEKAMAQAALMAGVGGNQRRQ